MTDTATTPATTTVATATPLGATTATTITRGIKTSEGVLAYLATVMTGLFGAGIIPTAGTAALIATVAAIALTSAGYGVSRALVKGAA
jgi:hypothetical protein